MNNYTQQFLQLCREQEIRLTQERIFIVETIFSKHLPDNPLPLNGEVTTPDELCVELFNSGNKISRATVYRTFLMLETLGMLSQSNENMPAIPTTHSIALPDFHALSKKIGMLNILSYFPQTINTGWLLTGYTLPKLKLMIESHRMVLPICSLGTPVKQLATLAPLVLPPLYHEAMDDSLKQKLLSQIDTCFPYLQGTAERENYSGQFEIVELPVQSHPAPTSGDIIGFSVDTAVEEHGPHLPLMTDTIQSYEVLQKLVEQNDDFSLAPPLEYGHLTWGLPFGLSIDITPQLVTEYVTGYMNALQRWCNPQAMYVVDVHGSIVHREAIQKGMQNSNVTHSAFRWLHEPHTAVAGDRGDQHAGGVETALVEYINPQLVEPDWQNHIAEIAATEMEMQTAINLSSDLPAFVKYVQEHNANGIVGKIRNYHDLNAPTMFDEMLTIAQNDLEQLRTL